MQREHINSDCGRMWSLVNCKRKQPRPSLHSCWNRYLHCLPNMNCMPSSNNSNLADQVHRASQSEAHKQSVSKKSRPIEQQAPNKKAKLSSKPQKLPAAHQPARGLSLTRSDTAAHSESESKPRQVGIYDRPWRKHMKPSSSDRQPSQQEAAAAAAPVRARQPAEPKVIFKLWYKMLAHCPMCPRASCLYLYQGVIFTERGANHYQAMG